MGSTSLLVRFHDRELAVGGLFNAYEKALHFALITEAYRDGYWSAEQEQRLGRGARIDVCFALDERRKLWVEMKQWWFLYNPAYAYWTAPTYRNSLLQDWEKLTVARQGGDRRAVMLMRAWDSTEQAKQDADNWLREVSDSKQLQGGSACEGRAEELQVPEADGIRRIWRSARLGRVSGLMTNGPNGPRGAPSGRWMIDLPDGQIPKARGRRGQR